MYSLADGDVNVTGGPLVLPTADATAGVLINARAIGVWEKRIRP